MKAKQTVIHNLTEKTVTITHDGLTISCSTENTQALLKLSIHCGREHDRYVTMANDTEMNFLKSDCLFHAATWKEIDDSILNLWMIARKNEKE